MKVQCMYCGRMASKVVPMDKGRYACHACAQKSQDYMIELLRRWMPESSVVRFIPLPETTKSKKEKRKKKKMKKDLFSTIALCTLFLFAGTTIRCNIDDDDDKDKDQSMLLDAHGHDVRDAFGDALPGALVDFRNPDYACMAIGSIDRDNETDFDVLFITGCHKQ